MLNTIILEKIGSMDDQEIIEALNEIQTLKDISFEEALTLYQIIESYFEADNEEIVSKTVDAVNYLSSLHPELKNCVKIVPLSRQMENKSSSVSIIDPVPSDNNLSKGFTFNLLGLFSSTKYSSSLFFYSVIGLLIICISGVLFYANNHFSQKTPPLILPASSGISTSSTGPAMSDQATCKPFNDDSISGIFPPAPTDSIELAFVSCASIPFKRYLTSSYDDSKILEKTFTEKFKVPLKNIPLARKEFEKTKEFEERKKKALELTLAAIQKNEYSITRLLDKGKYDPDTEILAIKQYFSGLEPDIFVRIEIPEECKLVKATARYDLNKPSSRDSARYFPEFQGLNDPPTAISRSILNIEIPMDCETAKKVLSETRFLRITFSVSFIPDFSVFADPSWGFSKSNMTITDTKVTAKLLIFNVRKVELFSLEQRACIFQFPTSQQSASPLEDAVQPSFSGSSSEKTLVDSIVAKDYSSFLQQIANKPKFIFSLDKTGKNLFHYLAVNGNAETIIAAMTKCANSKEAVNAYMNADYGPTPLCVACENENFAGANALLDIGADPNLFYGLGDVEISPLSIAIEKGNKAFVSKLLEKKAKPDFNSLIGAIRSNQRDIVELFLLSGLDINSMDEYRSPLNSAIKCKNSDMIMFLVSKRADINKFPDIDPSPLFLAIENGLDDIAFLFIEKGADINFTSFASNGETPLHLTVKMANYRLMKKLLQHGARKDLKDNKQQTPFDLAKNIGDQRAMAILLGSKK